MPTALLPSPWLQRNLFRPFRSHFSPFSFLVAHFSIKHASSVRRIEAAVGVDPLFLVRSRLLPQLRDGVHIAAVCAILFSHFLRLRRLPLAFAAERVNASWERDLLRSWLSDLLFSLLFSPRCRLFFRAQSVFPIIILPLFIGVGTFPEMRRESSATRSARVWKCKIRFKAVL